MVPRYMPHYLCITPKGLAFGSAMTLNQLPGNPNGQGEKMYISVIIFFHLIPTYRAVWNLFLGRKRITITEHKSHDD